MTLELFLRYLHFISIFVIVGALASEHLLLKPLMKRGELVRLARIDGAYGLAALTLLIAGLTLWQSGIGKPASFYSQNWIFHLKLACFGAIGLLSIYPTVYFIKNRKGNPAEDVAIPKGIFWLVRIELLLLFITPLLAGLMSRGVGYFGTD